MAVENISGRALFGFIHIEEGTPIVFTDDFDSYSDGVLSTQGDWIDEVGSNLGIYHALIIRDAASGGGKVVANDGGAYGFAWKQQDIPPDQYVQVYFRVASWGYNGVCLRTSGNINTLTGITIHGNAGELYVGIYVAGSLLGGDFYDWIAGGDRPYNIRTGDILRAEINGTDLRVYINEELITQWYNAQSGVIDLSTVISANPQLEEGYAGVYLQYEATSELDDFECGALGGGEDVITSGATGTLTLGVPSALIEGGADITFSQRAELKAKVSLAGDTDVQFTERALLIGIGHISAAEGLSFTTNGTLSSTHIILGKTDTTFGVTGQLQAVGRLSGRSEVTYHTQAEMTATASLTGSANVLFTTSAILSGGVDIRGAISVEFKTTATLSSNLYAEGSDSITFVSNGTLKGKVSASAQTAIAFDSSANLTYVTSAVDLQATAPVEFSTTGRLSVVAKVSGRAGVTFRTVGTTGGSIVQQIVAEALVRFAGDGRLTALGTLQSTVVVSFTTESILVGLTRLIGEASLRFAERAVILGWLYTSAKAQIVFDTYATLIDQGKVSGLSSLMFSVNGTLNLGELNLEILDSESRITLSLDDRSILTDTLTVGNSKIVNVVNMKSKII